MTVSLKVMLVLTRLNVGGVSHQAILLGKGLQGHGCEVVLVCGQEEAAEGNMLVEAAAEGLRVIQVPSLRRRISPINDLRALVGLVQLMRRERPHVVQTNMAKAGQLGRLAARLSGVPVVLHVYHGHVLHSYFNRVTTRLVTGFERWMGRGSDGIITLTDGLRRELAGYDIAPYEKIAVIPSLFDPAPLREETPRLRGQFRAELGLSGDVPLIGLVGRLVAVKNPKMLLDAAKQLRDLDQNAHFVLVGDGDLRPELEAYAERHGLSEMVTVTGWRDDLARVYADLNIAVICSLNEGSPISVLEAMAAGVPVIATRVGGVPDIVSDGQTGILIGSEDTSALADAIHRLLDDPDQARVLAETARRAVAERFGISQAVERYLATYRDILERKGVAVPFPASTSATKPPIHARSAHDVQKARHLERTA